MYKIIVYKYNITLFRFPKGIRSKFIINFNPLDRVN